MCSATSIGIDDDLSAGQSGISVRASDHEFPGGVDKILDVIVEQCAQFLAGFGFHARHQYADYILSNLGEHVFIGLSPCLVAAVLGLYEGVVLCRHDDGVYAQRLVVVAVFDGDLTLGVGSEIGHLPTFLAYFREGEHDEVCQIECCRHVVVGFVGGIAKHHALISGALLLLFLARHTPIDIFALLVDGGEDAAGVVVELILGLGIADLLDGAPRHSLQIHIFG